MKVHFLIIFIIIFSVCLLNASSEDYLKIKNSSDYYIGECVSSIKERVNDEQMQKTALSKMILQMQSTVKVDISDDQTERDGKIQGELRQTIAMSSQIKLTNFKYISYSDKNNKYMLAYMNKTAYKTWLDAESERIKSRMQEAIEKEDILGLGDIIPIYLNLYAQTLLIPQAIMYENKADLNLYLYDILYEYLKESRKRSNVQKPNPQTPDIYPVSFDVRYMQMPVNNVKLAFDSDKIYKVVVGGNAELYIDGHSSVQKKTEKVVMTYDTQLAELADNIKGILDEHPIIYTFNEDLDFSKLVKVDFEIIQDGAEVCLTPIASNISVNEIQWQFGDDSYPITETKPKYKYNKNGKYTVTLTINRAVSVSKVIVVNDNRLIEKQENIVIERKPKIEKEKEIVLNLVDGLSELLEFTDVDNAIRWLVGMKKDGRIIYGTRSNFQKTDQCYVLIFSPVNKEVLKIIGPGQDDRRMDLLKKVKIDDFENEIKGKGVIWIQFLD